MAKLKDLDQMAEEKGSKLVTVWQFVKFIGVSMIATVVQFGSLNLLYLIPAVRALETQEVHWFVFDYDLASGGMKTFIAFNIANVLAQIVAFFVNRKATFGGTTSIPVTLTIYLVVTAGLVCFSAWLAPALTAFLVGHKIGVQLAGNISAIACGFIQFIVYFPVSKLLMRNKDKDKGKEETAEKAEA